LNVESEEAKTEAENMKQSLNDNTINKLARYVHKELGLMDLNCGYDINKEKCRSCARRKIF
jgi:Mn-dependent DtxR family transcriptional regulator